MTTTTLDLEALAGASVPPPPAPPTLTAVRSADGDPVPFLVRYAVDLADDTPIVMLTVGDQVIALSPTLARALGAELAAASGAAAVAATNATYLRVTHGYTDTHLERMFAQVGQIPQDTSEGHQKP